MSPQFCREQFKTPYFIECLCKHSNRINPTKNPPAEGSQQNITFLFSDCMLSSRPPNNLFLYYLLILSKIDSKWFCLWGEEGGEKKWNLPSEERKKKITAAHFSRYHGNGTFKILSLMRTAGRERLITRETICYSFGESLGDWLHTLFFSLSLSHTDTRTHTHKNTTWHILYVDCCEKSSLFCPVTALQPEDNRSAVIASWCQD